MKLRTRLFAVVLVVGLTAVSCTGSDEPDGSQDAAPASFSEANSAVQEQLGVELDVPDDTGAAASYLAEQAFDPETGVAAVKELLARSGIPVIAAEDGSLVAELPSPSFVDAPVYDFQVPTMASALQEGRTWSMDEFATFVTEVSGAKIDGGALGRALDKWLKTKAGDPLDFHIAAINALGSHHEDGGLDPVQFHLLGASLFSDLGDLNGAELSSAFVAAGDEVAQPSCEGTLDEPTGAAQKFYEDTVKGGLDKYLPNGGKVVGAAENAALFTDWAIAAIIVAGLQIQVESNAAGKSLHYLHGESESDPAHQFSFTATVRFDSPLGGMVIPCGPWSQVQLPNNKPLPGIKVQWSLDGDHAFTTRDSSDKLGRGGGGGEETDANGQSVLNLVTQREFTCQPGSGMQGQCGKGTQSKGTQRASAKVDLTREPPIKLADLIGLVQGGGVAGPLLNVLMDVLKEIGAPSASSSVSISYHALPDYKVDYMSGGIRISGTKCRGPVGKWSITMEGNIQGIDVDGSIKMDIGDDLTGPLNGTFEADSGIFAIGIDISFQGTAEVDVEGGRIKVTNVSSSGDASGGAAGIDISHIFSSSGGSGGIPLQPPGQFCEVTSKGLRPKG